jgi:hypothetical protein
MVKNFPGWQAGLAYESFDPVPGAYFELPLAFYFLHRGHRWRAGRKRG